MIYLQREQAEFTKTKEEFGEAYTYLLEEMFDTFKKKGATRDTGSPIHHRQSPSGSLSIAQSKCRRIESIISESLWSEAPGPLADVIEECIDVANYVLYIATLCKMLQKERS
jgi:hypothetical protein